MKKLLSLLLVFALVLAGCSSSSDSDSDKSKDSEKTTEKEETTLDNGDYKGIYKDETEEDDGSTTTTTTTVTFTVKDGDITKVKFDAKKNGVDKRDTEAYGLNPDGENAGTWATQADAVATYVEENDSFPTLDDEGKDTETGATIGLTDFEKAFNNAELVDQA